MWVWGSWPHHSSDLRWLGLEVISSTPLTSQHATCSKLSRELAQAHENRRVIFSSSLAVALRRAAYTMPGHHSGPGPDGEDTGELALMVREQESWPSLSQSAVVGRVDPIPGQDSSEELVLGVQMGESPQADQLSYHPSQDPGLWPQNLDLWTVEAWEREK